VSVKKGEIVAAFKTLPTGQPVSHVTLGRGQAIQRDKIFVAQGQTVRSQLSTTDAAALKSVADKCAAGFRCKASPRKANSFTTLILTWQNGYLLCTSVTTAYG